MESRKTLGEWLDYIEAMHGGAEVIDLGLGRMTEMISRMGIHFDCPVFTVAGTNGKGAPARCSNLFSGLPVSGSECIRRLICAV